MTFDTCGHGVTCVSMLSAVVATNDLPGLRERKKQRTHDDLQRIAGLMTDRASTEGRT